MELVAALEGSTAPRTWTRPRVSGSSAAAPPGPRSSRWSTAPVGVDDPQRQGLRSAVLGEGRPAQHHPGGPDHQGGYTPVWDVTPVAWTQVAIDSGQRVQLRDSGEVANAYAKGLLTSAGSGPANSSLKGVRALPGISNCPVVVEF